MNMILKDGAMQNGKLHRNNDLPAIEYAHGGKHWYVNGKSHRDNGLPAIENTAGKFWCEHDKFHRLGDLPAVEYVDGGGRWYIYGKNYSYEQVYNYYKTLKGFGKIFFEENQNEAIKKSKMDSWRIIMYAAKRQLLRWPRLSSNDKLFYEYEKLIVILLSYT
jgi:hypothetical protein